MSARSLNKVQLIGNLTRDPELRYTPTGAAVCTIGLATNRTWTTDSGEKKEETEFHRVVAWNKLAELCSQLLAKGRKIYVEGRLRTNSWTAQDSRRPASAVSGEPVVPAAEGEAAATHESSPTVVAQPEVPKASRKKSEEVKAAPSEDVNPDDIPF
jgi:single-strand DNA-binding protein